MTKKKIDEGLVDDIVNILRRIRKTRGGLSEHRLIAIAIQSYLKKER